MRAILHRAILLTLFTARLAAQEWPKTHTPVVPKVEIIASPDDFHRYATANYRIVSPEPLDRAPLNKFAQTAESVSWVLKLLPLPLYAPPPGEKPLIVITSNENAYLKAGGARGTAGYYNGRLERVIIQWEHFRPRPEDSRLIPEADYNLIVHELTHLGMHQFLGISPPWITEGVAEYLAATHTTGGQFNFTNPDRAIRDRLTRNSPADQKTIAALNLKSTLEMDGRAWHQMTLAKEPFETLQAYKSALLLTHFYFHGSSERRSEMKLYLEQLGKITRFTKDLPALVTQKDLPEIQEKLTRYWAARGVQLDWK
jgi:hypothetical protein